MTQPPLPEPFFIVGPPRSGTTLLTQVLDAHADLAVLAETWVFHLLWRLGSAHRFATRRHGLLLLNQIWHYVRWTDPLAARVVAETALRYHAAPLTPRAVVRTIGTDYARRRGASTWGEKTPVHSLHEREISALFPGARRLQIVRDPRDVIASWVRTWNAGRLDAAYLARAASEVRRNLRAILDDGAPAGRERLLVRFEELTATPRDVLQRVCAFLEVPFDDSALAFHSTDRSRRFATVRGHGNLARPFLKDRVGSSREFLPSGTLAFIEACLAREMAELGYEPAASSKVSPDLGPFVGKVERLSTGSSWSRRRLRFFGEAKVAVTVLPGALATRLLGHDLARSPDEWLRRLDGLPPAEPVPEEATPFTKSSRGGRRSP